MVRVNDKERLIYFEKETLRRSTIACMFRIKGPPPTSSDIAESIALLCYDTGNRGGR